MRFVPGDRVVIVGGPSSRYFGFEGEVVSDSGGLTMVQVDKEYHRKVPHSTTGPWSFYRPSWKLDLVDKGSDEIEEMFS